MGSKIVLVFLMIITIIIIFITTSSVVKFDDEVDHVQPPVQVDHYLLALTWPFTFCLKHPTKKCLGTAHETYTIHGIFTADSQERPIPCGKPPTAFDVSQIAGDLETKLQKLWPNLNGEDSDFWKKEWIKHGCLTNWKIREFFEMAVRLRNALDTSIRASSGWQVPNGDAVYQYLKIKGVTPSSTTYPIARFEAVFQWIASPPADSVIVVCDKKKTMFQTTCHLLELRFCFTTTTFKLIPCKATRHPSCQDSKGIVIYTDYPHIFLHVDDNDLVKDW